MIAPDPRMSGFPAESFSHNVDPKIRPLRDAPAQSAPTPMSDSTETARRRVRDPQETIDLVCDRIALAVGPSEAEVALSFARVFLGRAPDYKAAFLATLGAVAFGSVTGASPRWPVAQRVRAGLQLYTVRDPMAKDAVGTLKRAAALGYRNFETYGFERSLYVVDRVGRIVFCNPALADLIATAGAAAGEPLWRMPLVEDYEERLESKVADADNAAGGPGAITAALFLRHFTAGLPWAHLDIASVGDSPVDAFEWTSGATGFGARALLHWLELREPLAGVTA